MKKKVFIVGSGPVGTIAADYFINKSDFRVEILDIGTDNKKQVKLKSKEFIPSKTLFGNAFMYLRIDKIKFIFDKFSSFYTSHAKGGLSNVWGANISFIHNKYLGKWGLNMNEFKINYHYILKKIKTCSRVDMIDEDFELSINGEHVINSGLSFDHSNFSSTDKKILKKNNLSIGLSKLALDKNTCISCNSCMVGCEQNSIFNSVSLLESLILNPKFRYRKNIKVDSFIENKKGILVYVTNLQTKQPQVLTCDYLLIAAGTIDSTLIVKSSLNMKKEFKIKESKKFYFPVISTKFRSSSNIDKSISLSHLFIQNNEKDSLIHCQLYPLYFVLDYCLRSKFGDFFVKILCPFKFLLKYFYLAMVYLDSEDSGCLSFTKTGNDIYIRGYESKKSKIRLNVFINRLKKVYKITKLIPLNFILSSKLGHSQHFGSTMPMTYEPSTIQTDMFGRPFNQKRTYIIDTSVLPSIPALPTTIISMANALRICRKIINQEKK